MGDGNIDPKDVTILKGIGDWWKVNGDSIRGTERTPLPVQTWGESTLKGNTLYLHVFNWPTNGQLVVGGLKSNVKGAYLLNEMNPYDANGNRDVVINPMSIVRRWKVNRLNPLDVVINVPNNPPDHADSVVVLGYEPPIQTDTNRLLQPEYASDTLRAFDGKWSAGLRPGPGKKTDDVIQDWTKTNQFVSWSVRLNEAATYNVFINYNTTNSVTNTFIVNFGSQTLEGTTRKNNGESLPVGKISLNPGTFEIKVAPKEIKGNELFKLRNLELRPTAQ